MWNPRLNSSLFVVILHVDLFWTRAHTLERKEHCCLSLNASEDVVKGTRHKKNKEFAKVKSRLDAETMNSAQVDRARVEHGFCVEPCLFCFLFSVFCLLFRVSLKRGFLLCHFCLSSYLYCLFSCLLVVLCLPWTLYALCLRTTAA